MIVVSGGKFLKDLISINAKLKRILRAEPAAKDLEADELAAKVTALLALEKNAQEDQAVKDGLKRILRADGADVKVDEFAHLKAAELAAKVTAKVDALVATQANAEDQFGDEYERLKDGMNADHKSLEFTVADVRHDLASLELLKVSKSIRAQFLNILQILDELSAKDLAQE